MCVCVCVCVGVCVFVRDKGCGWTRGGYVCTVNQLIFAGDLISLISPLGTNRPK